MDPLYQHLRMAVTTALHAALQATRIIPLYTVGLLPHCPPHCKRQFYTHLHMDGEPSSRVHITLSSIV